MNKKYVGDGMVCLLSGGGKIWTDIAAKFTRSGKELDEIVASDYNKKIVRSIIEKGHGAAVEFDWFIFGVEGYSRVTETQLVRKRIASYMIKSGRYPTSGGRESYDVVIPRDIDDVEVGFEGKTFDINKILKLLEKFYRKGLKEGKRREAMRFLKPQATEFKGLIGMNAHALRDWFKINTCMRAQYEIRDMAKKMLGLCKQAVPDLFMDAGPSCVRLGYCPENEMQHPDCDIITKNEAMKAIKKYEQLKEE